MAFDADHIMIPEFGMMETQGSAGVKLQRQHPKNPLSNAGCHASLNEASGYGGSEQQGNAPTGGTGNAMHHPMVVSLVVRRKCMKTKKTEMRLKIWTPKSTGRRTLC